MFTVTFRVVSNVPSVLFTGLGQVGQLVQGSFSLLWTSGASTKMSDV